MTKRYLPAFTGEEIMAMHAENKRLRAAIVDAHGLIDNNLVVPWIMAHKLDDVLNEQSARHPSPRDDFSPENDPFEPQR